MSAVQVSPLLLETGDPRSYLVCKITRLLASCKIGKMLTIDFFHVGGGADSLIDFLIADVNF